MDMKLRRIRLSWSDRLEPAEQQTFAGAATGVMQTWWAFWEVG
jgi:hypothetical protein